MRALSCIRATVGEAAAAKIARAAAGERSLGPARRLHYPYYWFRFRATSATILGRITTRVLCLVDARTGQFATSDPFDTVSRSLPEGDVLDPALGEGEAAALARRQAPHAIRARRRSLRAGDVELRGRGLIYKPFWVVPGETTSLLVDGVTGAVFPLAGSGGRA